MKNEDRNDIRCRRRLSGPEEAGAVSGETLREWALAFPHLRPCAKRNWEWIDRKHCGKCPEREGEE